MNRMMSPSAAFTSSSTPFSRSSNSPRYLAPAISAPMSSAISLRSFSVSGTSPLAMRSARPSAIAVLPTPGSPISAGLFLVRRARIWMVRRISSSRPITGSSFPSRATWVRSRANFLSASYRSSAPAVSAVRPWRSCSIAPFRACGFTPPAASALPAALVEASAKASSSRSTVTKLSPAFCATCSAWSSTRTRSLSRPGELCAPEPETAGILAKAASVSRSTRFASPPAAWIRPDAMP